MHVCSRAELARRGAEEAGKAYYFSIADFEAALLHGILELKSVEKGETAKFTIDLTPKSPSSIVPAEIP